MISSDALYLYFHIETSTNGPVLPVTRGFIDFCKLNP